MRASRRPGFDGRRSRPRSGLRRGRPNAGMCWRAWTAERAERLEELAGEIGAEDTSLVERAESRADRFAAYSDARQADAEQARAAVSAIADQIPLGQPILVGHHSEARARRDAERIE